MQRFEAINQIIREKGFSKYLEIGVCNPWECFDFINCQTKHSVDPGYEVDVNNNFATYKFESDEFFNNLRNGNLDLPKDYKWDVVFIDGLHISDQVFKDFLNAKQHLSDDGFIVFHDCNPTSIHLAREDYIVNGVREYWNGTVWKAVQRIRTDFDVDWVTINDDWGIGVCRLNRPATTRLSPDLNPFYEYNRFSDNRNLILNLVDGQVFYNWLRN